MQKLRTIMDITGTRLEGKEKLLAEDYTLTPPHFSTNSHRTRCVNLTVVLAVLSITGCVISCICAVYCHRALTEIELYRHDSTNARMSAPLVASTEASNLARAVQDANLYSDLDSFEFSGEESEIDDYDTDDFEDEYEYTDEVFADGSGDGYEAGNSDSLDQTDHIRTRRASAPADKCKDKCKGKKGKKQTRCIKRCQEGRSSINLPVAYFECLSESDISKTFPVDPSAYKYVTTEGVPLEIFKRSEWVDDKSSPVRFAGSVAEAKSSGIYLVYAQAYIGGSQPEKSISIVQKRNGAEINALSCNNGVHPDHYDSTSRQMQTCSVLGLMNVQNGDSIEVQKSSAALDITLDKDKTYFGVVQLSHVALKQNTKRNRKNRN